MGRVSTILNYQKNPSVICNERNNGRRANTANISTIQNIIPTSKNITPSSTEVNLNIKSISKFSSDKRYFSHSKNNNNDSNEPCIESENSKLNLIFTSLGIDKHYLEIFFQNRIVVDDLILISKEDLKEMQIPIGPRNRLLFFIDKFSKYLFNKRFNDNNIAITYEFLSEYFNTNKKCFSSQAKSIHEITNVQNTSNIIHDNKIIFSSHLPSYNNLDLKEEINRYLITTEAKDVNKTEGNKYSNNLSEKKIIIYNSSKPKEIKNKIMELKQGKSGSISERDLNSQDITINCSSQKKSFGSFDRKCHGGFELETQNNPLKVNKRLFHGNTLKDFYSHAVYSNLQNSKKTNKFIGKLEKVSLHKPKTASLSVRNKKYLLKFVEETKRLHQKANYV